MHRLLRSSELLRRVGFPDANPLPLFEAFFFSFLNLRRNLYQVDTVRVGNHVIKDEEIDLRSATMKLPSDVSYVFSLLLHIMFPCVFLFEDTTACSFHRVPADP